MLDLCSVASAFSVPVWVFAGIIMTESGGRLQVVHQNTDGSRDYGLMQINTYWVRELSLDTTLLVTDPQYNLYWGGWILSECMDRYPGNLARAVGCFHSPTPHRALRYATEVIRRGLAWAEEHRGCTFDVRSGGGSQ